MSKKTITLDGVIGHAGALCATYMAWGVLVVLLYINFVRARIVEPESFVIGLGAIAALWFVIGSSAYQVAERHRFVQRVVIYTSFLTAVTAAMLAWHLTSLVPILAFAVLTAVLETKKIDAYLGPLLGWATATFAAAFVALALIYVWVIPGLRIPFPFDGYPLRCVTSRITTEYCYELRESAELPPAWALFPEVAMGLAGGIVIWLVGKQKTAR